MPTTDEQIRRVLRIKRKHESALISKANVVAVGIGMRERARSSGDEPIIIVSVTRKVPIAELADDDVVPGELEGVRVEVQAVGPMHPSSSANRKAPSEA